MANKKRLIETLAYICTHPKHWNQASWRCKTGMCFAGHAVVSIEGCEPIVPHKLIDNDFVTYHDLLELVRPKKAAIKLKVNQRFTEDSEYPMPEAFKPSLRLQSSTMSDEAQGFLDLDGREARSLFAANNTIDDLVDLIAEYTGLTKDQVIEETKATAKRNGWRWPRKELAEIHDLHW